MILGNRILGTTQSSRHDITGRYTISPPIYGSKVIPVRLKISIGAGGIILDDFEECILGFDCKIAWVKCHGFI